MQHVSSAAPIGVIEPLPADLLPLADQAEADWRRASGHVADPDAGLPPTALELARRVWACSEFCAQSCARDPATLLELLDSGDLQHSYAGDHYAAVLGRVAAAAEDEPQLLRVLRRQRQREMLRIAWRDLAGLAGLDETMGDLSRLADAAIDAALTWLHRDLVAQWGTPTDADGRPQGMAVIAMGKLGAFELNFSSDIDLIFVFGNNGETVGARRQRSNEEFFVRLGKRLIDAMDRQTEDGRVFRVDMRLRPFGTSGPLAASVDAMEVYYQRHGRDWERYAWIKGRVCAGDRAVGTELQQRIQPFVFRRYLDFGAFDALRDMHGMIRSEVEKRGLANHVKLGPGGIREIEFIAQSFQLIRGGREPAFQERRVQRVLASLGQAGYLEGIAVDELIEAYRFLRNTEHRLQALRDQQTHDLPTDHTDQLRIAAAMGFSDWPTFKRVLDQHRVRVAGRFEAIAGAGDRNDTGAEPFDSVWQRRVAEDRQRDILRNAGFTEPDKALAALARLHDSHQVRAMSAEGRRRLDHLMPLLLATLAGSRHGDTAIGRVFDIVEAVARRSVYLVLLVEYGTAREVLVRLCGLSPLIAHYIGRYPLLLDELLDPRTLYSPPAPAELERELDALCDAAGDDEERRLDSLRQFKQASVLRVAAADITEAAQLMEVSDHLTAIAEIVVRKATHMAWEYLVPQHGRPRYLDPGGTRHDADFAVVAYGKLGGFELSYGSDLDLIFLHDSHGTQQQTDGPRPLENAVFFTRLAKRVVHILTALTAAGTLYDVDLRLRPSGESGLMVSSMDAFEEYQLTQAWTWEHQALVRARVLLGGPALTQRFEQVRGQVLTRDRDPGQLCRDVVEMRERMRGELGGTDPSRFRVKQDSGGITDIEFLVQYLMLTQSRRHPELLEFTGNVYSLQAFQRLGVLDPAIAEALIEAYKRLRHTIHRCALQEVPAEAEATDFESTRKAVRAAWTQVLGDCVQDR